MNIAELKALGYDVKINHLRGYGDSLKDCNYYSDREADALCLGTVFAPRLDNAGITIVTIYANKHSNEVVAQGIAKVNPKDRFNRKLGVKIALGRAVKHSCIFNNKK